MNVRDIHAIVNARDVTRNDFVTVGAFADPSGTGGMRDAAEAVKKIAQTKSLFYLPRRRVRNAEQRERALEGGWRNCGREVVFECGRLSPPALENLLRGQIIRKDGSSFVSVGGVLIHALSHSAGSLRATIELSAIIISRERIESSARNCLPGKVSALSEKEDGAVATVDVRLKLAVHVTRDSFDELGITLGSEVFLTFKASAVTVF